MQTQISSQTEKFRKAYADAVIPWDLSETEWAAANEAAQPIRELQWKGERIPLSEAAELYALIPGYNDFEPDMLARLLAEFPDAGIEATPGRAYSVVVYLHVPDALFCGNPLKDEVEKFVRDKIGANEIDWEDDDDPKLSSPVQRLRVWWD